jgi:TPP-dependent pyruvate/acetoin dehydrogenase alpha subunit
MRKWNVEELKAFESEIAEIFNRGEIRAPVHLSDGNEIPLIKIFEEIRDQDWVICSWRSHYQCLLKGVPPEELKLAIMEGRSISLSFARYRVFSSAIVGGQLPIAVGAAFAEKIKKSGSKVWCFLGDMTAETGMAQTCIRYSLQHDLPINFIIEDNGISVLTETRRVWNSELLSFERSLPANVQTFQYVSKYPHAGAGVRVQF